ncbi:MAG: hypothetical protein ACO1N7_04025 [Sphingobacteriaceae bacterium]
MEPKAHSNEKNDLITLYLKVNDWVSDLDFLEDESKFFKKVIAKYLLTVNASENRRIKQVQMQLYKLEEAKSLLNDELLNLRHLLDRQIKRFTKEQDDKIRDLDKALEFKISQLNDSFRTFKLALYKITQQLVVL